MMKKFFYGLAVCFLMFAVVLCTGVASAAPGDPCDSDSDCIDELFFNGIGSFSAENTSTCDPEIEGIDLDENCLISTEELKIYSAFIKGRQKAEKTLLKNIHKAEKDFIKYLKSEYGE